MTEKMHAPATKAVETETGERRSMWHKYVNIAVVNYNTYYHTSTGCEPNIKFNGRIPYHVVEEKMGLRPQKPTTLK